MSVISWVTNPLRTQYQTINDEILNLLENSSIVDLNEILIEEINNGVTQYTAILNSIVNNDQFDHICNLIDLISFEPLTISVLLTSSIINTDFVNGYMSIIRGYLQPKIADSIEITYQRLVTKYDNVLVYKPTLNDQPFYIDPLYYGAIISELDWEKYYGYELISTNSMTEYAIDVYLQNRPRFDKRDLIQMKTSVGSFWLIKVTDNNIISVDQIRDVITTLSSSNYTAFKLSSEKFTYLNSRMNKILAEVALLWNFDLISVNENRLVIRSNSSLEFLDRVDTWFTNTLERIFSNQLPIFTINGNWRDKSIETIKYMAYRAYSNVVSNNTLLIFYIDQLKINSNKSITGVFSTSETVLAFIDFIKAEQQNDYYINNDISIYPNLSLNQAVQLRLKYNSFDSSLLSLIFQQNETEYTLVVDTEQSLNAIDNQIYRRSNSVSQTNEKAIVSINSNMNDMAVRGIYNYTDDNGNVIIGLTGVKPIVNINVDVGDVVAGETIDYNDQMNERIFTFRVVLFNRDMSSQLYVQTDEEDLGISTDIHSFSLPITLSYSNIDIVKMRNQMDQLWRCGWFLSAWGK
jgi:hypothetical protein